MCVTKCSPQPQVQTQYNRKRHSDTQNQAFELRNFFFCCPTAELELGCLGLNFPYHRQLDTHMHTPGKTPVN
jgi:hypothetical protein